MGTENGKLKLKLRLGNLKFIFYAAKCVNPSAVLSAGEWRSGVINGHTCES